MKIYDISLPLSTLLAGWPGDTPFEFKLVSDLRRGDAVNVGSVQASLHAGTHVDAPFHFSQNGRTLDAIALEAFIGAACVIDVRARDPIGTDAFEGVNFSKTPRVLLRTKAWPDRATFPKQIPVLAADVPAFLAGNGVCLIGLDVPSFDAIDSKTLPIHHALAGAGIQLLEALDLDAVPPGEYELTALPLRIVGADASPVRAILRALG